MVTKDMMAGRLGAASSESVRDSFVAKTATLNLEIFRTGANLHDLHGFSDIPESWLDGGPSRERRAALADKLEYDAFPNVIRDSISASAAWLGMDPQAVKAFIPEYWSTKFYSELGGRMDVGGMVDDAMANVKALVTVLEKLRADVEHIIGNPQSGDFIDRVEEIFANSKKFDGLASRLTTALSAMTVGPGGLEDYLLEEGWKRP